MELARASSEHVCWGVVASMVSLRSSHVTLPIYLRLLRVA